VNGEGFELREIERRVIKGHRFRGRISSFDLWKDCRNRGIETRGRIIDTTHGGENLDDPRETWTSGRIMRPTSFDEFGEFRWTFLFFLWE